MPLPACTMPLAKSPVPRITVPMRTGGADGRGARRCADPRPAGCCRVQGFTLPTQPGCIEHRRGAALPLVGEEVRDLLQVVHVRPVVREPHAVVERQLPAHLPVVLEVPLDVVVVEVALDELRALARRWRRCRAPRSRTGTCESSGLFVSTPKFSLPWNVGCRRVLRLVAVLDVDARLDRVLPATLVTLTAPC